MSRERAAFDVRDITPDRPQYLHGYAARTLPSEGVADPLKLRTAVLESAAGEKTVFVCADAFEFPRTLSECIFRRLSEKYALDSSRIVLNASHTHCAPLLTVPFYREGVWSLDEQYVEMFLRAVYDSVESCMEKLTECEVFFSTFHHVFGVNRRHRGKNGIAMRPNPDGCYEDEIPLLGIRRNGQWAGVLYSIACHPTSRGGQLVSADYPGAIAAAFPEFPLCFMQGAGGSAKPRFFTEDGSAFRSASQEDLIETGKRMAERIRAALDVSHMRRLSLNIASASALVRLPLDTAKLPKRETLAAILADDAVSSYEKACAKHFLCELEAGTIRKECEVLLNCLRLSDDLVVLCCSAELTAEAALRLKHALSASGRTLVILGYTGWTAAYLPTAQMLAEGGYEPVDSQKFCHLAAPFAPEIDSILLHAARTLLDQVAVQS